MNIGPEDLVDENLRIILGLIWSLILRYQIKADKGDGGARSAAQGHVKQQRL